MANGFSVILHIKQWLWSVSWHRRSKFQVSDVSHGSVRIASARRRILRHSSERRAGRGVDRIAVALRRFLYRLGPIGEAPATGRRIAAATRAPARSVGAEPPDLEPLRIEAIAVLRRLELDHSRLPFLSSS
jgi:hypothetical protein